MNGHPDDEGRLVVLVNRLARRGADSRWEASVRERLARRWSCDFVYPGTVEEMVALAASAIERRCRGIIAAGGDGTVGRVAHVVAGTGVRFGVIPLGNGNDFLRSLDLPRQPHTAADRIVGGPERRLDLGAANGRSFTTIGVVGVPADAALMVERITRRGSPLRRLALATGSMTYRAAGLFALAKAKRFRARVTVTDPDGRTAPSRDAEAFGICVTNGRFFGGGLGLPVDGAMNDGRLDLCLVPAMSRVRLIWAFLCLVSHWKIPAWALDIVPAARAVIDCDRPLEFAADGDRFGSGTRFEVNALPGALAMMC